VAAVLDAGRVDAVVFDMDGVVTDTAGTHRTAWGQAFDALLAHLGGQDQAPFSDDDYRRHVDGRARIDGVTSFLASRGLALPLGGSGDPPSLETAWGVANRKDELFRRALEEGGAIAFPSTLALARRLRAAGVATGVVTASRNRPAVLRAAGAEDLFDVAVDGTTAAELALPGKPDPATFLEAARRLGVDPHRAVVVEDALAGVEAGRRGRFGLVIGVARHGGEDDYRARGADVVVRDLAEVGVEMEPAAP
jgi:alpha,alpha-trehalase